MQIFLNNEQLDVTIEQETTVGEVFDSLNSWLSQGGIYPFSLELDDDSYETSERSLWQNRGVDGISSMKLKAGNLNELRARQMMTAVEYLNLLLQLINRNIGGESLENELASAMGEYPHIRSAAPQLMGMEATDFAQDFAHLDEAAQAYSNNPRFPGAERNLLQEFGARVDQLRILLLDRLQEVSYPKRELSAISQLLENMLPSLEEAGIALQTGNEREAYNLVFRISEMAAKLIRIMECLSIEDPQLTSDEMREVIGRVGDVIALVNESISNGDQVLLADQLEYDLAEVLQDLIFIIRSSQPEGQ